MKNSPDGRYQWVKKLEERDIGGEALFLRYPEKGFDEDVRLIGGYGKNGSQVYFRLGGNFLCFYNPESKGCDNFLEICEINKALFSDNRRNVRDIRPKLKSYPVIVRDQVDISEKSENSIAAFALSRGGGLFALSRPYPHVAVDSCFKLSVYCSKKQDSDYKSTYFSVDEAINAIAFSYEGKILAALTKNGKITCYHLVANNLLESNAIQGN